MGDIFKYFFRQKGCIISKSILLYICAKEIQKGMIDVQAKLYVLRKGVGMTQSDMANKLGISRGGYAKKELGKSQFTQDEMFKISDMFNLCIDDIFTPRKGAE